MVDAVRFKADPAQTGLFELAVGADGIAFTTTVVPDEVLVHVPTVTVTL